MKRELVKVMATILLEGMTLLALSACSEPSPAAPLLTPSPAAVLAPTTSPVKVPSVTPTRAAPVVTPAQAAATSTPAPVSTSNPTFGGVINIILKEGPYGFEPDPLFLQRGLSYTLRFAAPKELHTFTVADLGINITINSGQTIEQRVTLTKVGTFKLVCVVHEGEGMTGTLLVTQGP